MAQHCGGYGDYDYGNVLIYTGQGGSEKEDQIMNTYNASLVVSMKKKIPVRVVRGYQLPSKYAPTKGYRLVLVMYALI